VAQVCHKPGVLDVYHTSVSPWSLKLSGFVRVSIHCARVVSTQVANVYNQGVVHQVKTALRHCKL